MPIATGDLVFVRPPLDRAQPLDAAILGQFVTGRNLVGFAIVAVGLLVLDGRLIERLKAGRSG